MRLRGWAVAGVVGLAMLVAACGGDDDDGDDDAAKSSETTDEDTTTTAADDGTTTTTFPPEEQEVVDAVKGSFDAVIHSYDPPNHDHPELLAAYSGIPLEGFQQDLRLFEGRGHSKKISILEESYEVSSVSGDKAVVRSCTREEYQTFDTATGQATEELQEEIVNADNHLERIDGTWKVVKLEFLGEPCSFD